MKPALIDIPKIDDHRGNLSVVDLQTCLPFELKRVFYIYDIPTGVERGGHAHFKLHQFIWCLSGSIRISLIDSDGLLANFDLSLPWRGLYLPPMTWASEKALSAGVVYMVAASDYYDPDDYIRDHALFDSLIR